MTIPPVPQWLVERGDDGLPPGNVGGVYVFPKFGQTPPCNELVWTPPNDVDYCGVLIVRSENIPCQFSPTAGVEYNIDDDVAIFPDKAIVRFVTDSADPFVMHFNDLWADVTGPYTDVRYYYTVWTFDYWLNYNLHRVIVPAYSPIHDITFDQYKERADRQTPSEFVFLERFETGGEFVDPYVYDTGLDPLKGSKKGRVYVGEESGRVYLDDGHKFYDTTSQIVMAVRVLFDTKHGDWAECIETTTRWNVLDPAPFPEPSTADKLITGMTFEDFDTAKYLLADAAAEEYRYAPYVKNDTGVFWVRNTLLSIGFDWLQRPYCISILKVLKADSNLPPPPS